MRKDNAPTIHISYSPVDHELQSRLREHLELRGKEAGVTVIGYQNPLGSSPDGEVARMINNATAVVALLSPDYLLTPYFAKQELPTLLRRQKTKGLLIIPLMLRPCSSEHIPPELSRLKMPLGRVPLSHYPGEQLEIMLFRVSNEIIQTVKAHWEKTSGAAHDHPHHADTTPSTQPAVDDASAHEVPLAEGGTTDAANVAPPRKRARTKGRTEAAADRKPSSGESSSAVELISIDELKAFEFSAEAESFVKRARALGMFVRTSTPQLATPSLFFAMAEVGRGPSNVNRTPQFLWEHIRKTVTPQKYQKSYDQWFAIKHATLHVLSNIDSLAEKVRVMRPNVLDTFKLAEQFSRRTTPKENGKISARHLLAALLVPRQQGINTGAYIYMSQAGINPTPLRKSLFEFIAINVPDDNREEWSKILLGGAAGEADEPNAPQNVAERIRQLTEQVQERVPREREEAKGAKGAESFDVVSDASEADAPTKDGEARADDGDRTDDGEVADEGSAFYLSGFHTDDGRGRDFLNIESEVNALAALVAAWSVEPPLSIGLFGHWGSGKTFFMRKMMERVGRLARKARASKKPQRENGYYKNIIQIEFNAWHYIEGNLWASLVEHIFENLRLHGKERDSDVELRRREVLEQLDVQKVLEARAGEKKQKLIAAKNQAHDRAEEAKTRREEKLNLLSTVRQELAAQTGAALRLKEDIKPLAAEVGISKEALANAAELRAAFNETRGLWGRIRAQISWVKSRPPAERRKFALAVALAAAVSGALCLLAWLAQRALKADLSGVRAAVVPLVTSLSGALLVLRPYWRTVSAAVSEVLSLLEVKQREFAEAEARAEEEQRKRIAELESEINALSGKIVEAEGEEAQAGRRVRELQEELENTTPGRMLAEFIEDRAAASDYRRHLGVLAVIRRDFEKLARLISDQRKAERRGEEKIDDLTTINRIILYVDDLDRCPPERVVQVLQAIHLLLAFPLFVVVVGVDARWVSRSLRERYDLLLRDHEGEGQGDEMLASLGPGATPHDYLEKIFQIPYWLRPLEETGCRSLIEGLTRDSIAPEETSPPPQRPLDHFEPPSESEPVAQPPAASPEIDGETETAPDVPDEETRAGKRVERPSTETEELESAAPEGDVPQVGAVVERALASSPVAEEEAAEGEDDSDIDPHPKSLDLEAHELLFMQALAHVVGRSPRAVKRFINCYRLIKVGQGPKRLQKFLGDGGPGSEYRAVMLMLGIVTGVPDISHLLIERLKGEPGSETLLSFVKKVGGEPGIKGHPDWARVKAVLTDYAKAEGGHVPLGPLAEAASDVSRYSFRVTQAEQPTPRQERDRPDNGASAPARARTRARAPVKPAAEGGTAARGPGPSVSQT